MTRRPPRMGSSGTRLPDGSHGYGFRTHQDKPGQFHCCQDYACPKEHFISSLKGSRPVDDPWDGMLDSDGKVGK